tara:strand:- start:91 stop:306 length:216 start_codon:yes stop_codon:yes gene_type:complete
MIVFMYGMVVNLLVGDLFKALLVLLDLVEAQDLLDLLVLLDLLDLVEAQALPDLLDQLVVSQQTLTLKLTH